MELCAMLLQILGTTLVTLFSFFGLQISDNKDAYVELVQKVSISKEWLLAAKIGLFILLAGLFLSFFIELGAINQ